jgi:uncharacterized protein (TIGR02594 family)
MQPSDNGEEFAPWLRIAHRWDGLRELDDLGELNATVREFFRATRFPRELVNKRTAWCSAFACTVFELCSIPHPHSARARDFLDSPHFVALRAPVRGCLLVFERSAGGLASDLYGHVGFCDRTPLSATQADVVCFGGNQDNAACARRKKLEHLIASLWPKGWPLPPGAELA